MNMLEENRANRPNMCLPVVLQAFPTDTGEYRVEAENAWHETDATRGEIIVEGRQHNQYGNRSHDLVMPVGSSLWS